MGPAHRVTVLSRDTITFNKIESTESKCGPNKRFYSSTLLRSTYTRNLASSGSEVGKVYGVQRAKGWQGLDTPKLRATLGLQGLEVLEGDFF